MRACKRCRYGVNLMDQAGAAFVDCVALPPRPVVLKDQLLWITPSMKPDSKFGCFKLSWWKLIFGNGPRT